MDDFDGGKANSTHRYRDSAEREGSNKTPDLTAIKLQLVKQRERQCEDCRSVSVFGANCKVRYSLSTSEVTLVAQSILKTSFDANVLHAPSSIDQFKDTWRPHQNVSRKNVAIMAEPVKKVTA